MIVDEAVRIKKIRDVKTPSRGHQTDAGIDFYIPAISDELVKFINDQDIIITDDDIIIPAGTNVLIPSGIIIEIPVNHAGIFLNKSSISSKKNIIIGAQVVDYGYSGEVHLDLHNIGNFKEIVKFGDKIAQLLLTPISFHTPIIENNDVIFYNNNNSRGNNGFGSTGER